MHKYNSNVEEKTQEIIKRPKALPVNVSNIPEVLRQRNSWVVWRYECLNSKWTKPPYNANNFTEPDMKPCEKLASTTRPDTWSSFNTAFLLYKKHAIDGIGVCLKPPYTGIDLDDCRNEKGEINLFAQDIIKRLDSYTELSPSGRGIRIFVEGVIPTVNGKSRNRDDSLGIEIYDHSRYLTITGQHLDGTPAAINQRQTQLAALHAEIFPCKPQERSCAPISPALEDQPIVALASQARNGAKFRALYQGDWQNVPDGSYGSQSSADQALCNLLAFYTQDAAQIDRLFRSSGLYRDKWDRDDYRDRTIEKALSEVSDTYKGSKETMLHQAEIEAERIVGVHEEIKEQVQPEIEEQVQAKTSEDPALNAAAKALGQNVKRKSENVAFAPIVFQSWEEFCAVAASQKEDWLIPHWAEFGCLHILSGLPFSGKSCLIAALLAAIAKGTDFYEMPVPQVPFIIIDLENKERILHKRIAAEFANDPAAQMSPLFRRIERHSIPRPVTVDWIRHCIQSSGEQKGVLVIDTMRSAFAEQGRKENDNDDMSALLYPLQLLAHETGWAIILLHHNNKGSNHYSGAGVIAGACDYLWNWTSDKQKLTAKLEMDGSRDDHQFPLEFRFDMATQRNVYLGKSPELKQQETKTAKDNLLRKWLTLLPDSKEDAITIKAIAGLAVTAGLLKEDAKEENLKKQAQRNMQEAFNSQYCDIVGDGTKGDAYKYFTTEKGRLLRLGTFGTFGTCPEFVPVPNHGQG